MVLIFLFITNYDSLPPLPDLARSEFPEPEFWTEPPSNSFRANGLIGQFSGAGLNLDFGNFSLRGTYAKENTWDTTEAGQASLTYSLFLPRLVFHPEFHFLSFTRDRRYQSVNPLFGLRILAPSFIIGGTCDYNRWSVNDVTVNETQGEVFLALDRLKWIPQLTLAGIYTDRLLKPVASAQVNIGYFHLKLGSPIRTGFPSPDITLTYAEPWTNISANVRTGVQHNTLSKIFDPEMPIDYPTSVQAETLSLAADLRLEFNTRGQRFSMGGAYKEWIYRLDIDDRYSLSGLREVQEVNVIVSVHNHLVLSGIRLSNTIDFSYNTSDSAIALMSDYAVNDTFVMNIGIFEIAGDLRYVSNRNGIGKALPSYYTINTTAGMHLFFFKFYVAVHNITDETSEVYDGYFLTGRRYAAGIEFEKKL